MVILERHDQLELELYLRITREREPIAVAPELLQAVDRSRAAMLAHLESGVPAYGINTGLGYMARRPIEPADQSAFQRSIIRGRAAAIGPPLSEPVVRGAMLLRLAGFLSGDAGVSSALCRFIADRLNDGWFPVVPAGVTGAAGEIVPLAHLFQTCIGEGEVLVGDAVAPAAAALANSGVEPYELGAKEGLALINGAPLAPALSVPLALRADALLEHATLAGAMMVALTSASARPYSQRIGALKGDRGQNRVHRKLLELLADRARFDEPLQAPVSLRVIPQVHGAALDLLDHLHDQLGRELRAVTDSPVFLPASSGEPEGLYPTGNFHAQALTLLLASSGVGLVQVCNLVEKRLHRLLDARYSGLPEQLSRDPGRQSGLVILHKQVIGLVAQARALAAPATVHISDGSAGQEDFQAHTMLAALTLARILGVLELALAHELVALRQADDLSQVRLPPRLERAAAELARVIPQIPEDRSLAADVERARALIAAGSLVPGAPRSESLLATAET